MGRGTQRPKRRNEELRGRSTALLGMYAPERVLVVPDLHLDWVTDPVAPQRESLRVTGPVNAKVGLEASADLAAWTLLEEVTLIGTGRCPRSHSRVEGSGSGRDGRACGLATAPLLWHLRGMTSVMPAASRIDKVALVTGAASGIGKAIARRLVDAGAKVFLADLNESEAAREADSLRQAGGHAIGARLDVSSEQDWEAAMTRVLSDWERLDLCVNCAGIAFASPIVETSLADWRRVMTTNLDGVFLGTRQAMAAMKDRGGGCIINIASAAGIKPVSGNAVYGTSKAAIRFLTRVAALEGAPLNIRVNSISPGAVATPMWESTGLWPGQVAEAGGRQAALDTLVRDHGFAAPDEIAAAVVYLASEDARHITGVDLAVDNGFVNT